MQSGARRDSEMWGGGGYQAQFYTEQYVGYNEIYPGKGPTNPSYPPYENSIPFQIGEIIHVWWNGSSSEILGYYKLDEVVYNSSGEWKLRVSCN